MATGNIYRFPKRQADGSIRADISIKDENGNIQRVSELILESETPSISFELTEEINRLIENGDIIIPQTSASIGNMHIVDISSQLEAGKYAYNFVDKNNNPVKTSDIYRIFFNGVNVSSDIDISEDKLSFTFIDAYEAVDFGLPESRLVIDFIEEEEA